MATPVEQSADRQTAINGSTVTKPTNLANGDVILIWVIEYDNASPETPAITGFTRSTNAGPVREATSNIGTATALWRVRDGSEGASFTVTGLTAYTDLIAMRITGCASGGGFQVAANANGVSGTALAIPSIVTVNANNLALFLHLGYNKHATDTALSGWGSKIVNAFDGVNDIWTRAIATATTTSSPSTYNTFDSNSDAYVSLIVVFSDTAVSGGTKAPPPPTNRIRIPLLQRRAA